MTRWKKLGIIAGGGVLPQKLASLCARNQAPFHIIRLQGIVDEALLAHPGDDCAIGEAGKIFRTLRENNCDAVVMAGLVQRPDFSKLRSDWRGAALLGKIAKAALKGDGAILSALVDTFEAEGFLVVGAEEVLVNVTPDQGCLGKVAITERDLHDIKKAAAIIRALGPFDVGQGAVVAEGQVLAIEAAEGTDEMLKRCEVLTQKFSPHTASGVLVKMPKPGQELRVDLPTVGAETVRRAYASDLRGIAVLTGAALVLDREEMIALADEYGLFVYGFSTDELNRLDDEVPQGQRDSE